MTMFETAAVSWKFHAEILLVKHNLNAILDQKCPTDYERSEYSVLEIVSA